MSRHYLGHGFSVHADGMDLVFSHHEIEITQSEAACPNAGPFANAWIHNGFVNVDKEKRSKSLGNFLTVADVLERNAPEGFRWFLLTVLYRGPIQYDTMKFNDGRIVFPGVYEAERRVDYLYQSGERLRLVAEGSLEPLPKKLPPVRITSPKAAESTRGQAEQGMLDDLNTPIAQANLGDLAQKRKKARLSLQQNPARHGWF